MPLISHSSNIKTRPVGLLETFFQAQTVDNSSFISYVSELTTNLFKNRRTTDNLSTKYKHNRNKSVTCGWQSLPSSEGLASIKVFAGKIQEYWDQQRQAVNATPIPQHMTHVKKIKTLTMICLHVLNLKIHWIYKQLLNVAATSIMFYLPKTYPKIYGVSKHKITLCRTILFSSVLCLSQFFKPITQSTWILLTVPSFL